MYSVLKFIDIPKSVPAPCLTSSAGTQMILYMNEGSGMLFASLGSISASFYSHRMKLILLSPPAPDPGSRSGGRPDPGSPPA